MPAGLLHPPAAAPRGQAGAIPAIAPRHRQRNSPDEPCRDDQRQPARAPRRLVPGREHGRADIVEMLGHRLARREEIAAEAYRRYFERFDPDLYDPKDWARQPRAAGRRR